MSSGPRVPFSGILLVVLGALFLADQFHVLSFGNLFARWWPALLVLAGILNLVERPAKVFAPVVMIVVGVAVLLSKLGYLELSQVWKLWPIVLIAMGVSILAASGRGKG
jgi:hypothetical protein